MKETYSELEAEVIRFEDDDVIVTSGDTTTPRTQSTNSVNSNALDMF